MKSLGGGSAVADSQLQLGTGDSLAGERAQIILEISDLFGAGGGRSLAVHVKHSKRPVVFGCV